MFKIPKDSDVQHENKQEWQNCRKGYQKVSSKNKSYNFLLNLHVLILEEFYIYLWCPKFCGPIGDWSILFPTKCWLEKSGNFTSCQATSPSPKRQFQLLKALILVNLIPLRNVLGVISFRCPILWVLTNFHS